MRYARQEALEHIKKEGQKMISESSIIVVGVGALGSVAAELLARAGIGNLRLIDRDVVELHNLQRQSLYTEEDIDKPKALRAQKRLQEINSEITIEAHTDDLTTENIHELFGNTDLVLDGTDNLATRFLINDYACKYNVPWIYAAAVKDTGYVLPIKPKAFCFRCVFKEAKQLETCDTVGVLNTITHMIAAIQVTEALKILLEGNETPELTKVNIWKNEMQRYSIQKNASCLTCKGTFEYLEKQTLEVFKFCGSDTYQMRGMHDLASLKKRLANAGKVYDYKECLKFENLTIFKNRALIRAKSEQDAKSAYAKYIGN